MSHYFDSDLERLKSKVRTFDAIIKQKTYRFLTDSGVFSKMGMDFGTRLLLETITDQPSESVLDLGCGYGPIGIVLASQWGITPLMIDVNPRAIRLAKENAQRNHVTARINEGDGFSHINERFSLIVTNPPIRAGKKVIYDWFEQAGRFLEPDGALVFVIRKDQGAMSALAFCRLHYASATIINKKSGYFIIKCQNYLTV
jgi:16S rRNA (guanine1207-N2)-methyltransferase